MIPRHGKKSTLDEFSSLLGKRNVRFDLGDERSDQRD
jgi:hypothetical protein